MGETNNYCIVDLNIGCSEFYFMSFSLVYFNSILATTSISVVSMVYSSGSSAPTKYPLTAELIRSALCSGPIYSIVIHHCLLAFTQLYLIHFQYPLDILIFFCCSFLSNNRITIISTMFSINSIWLCSVYDIDRDIFHRIYIWMDSNYSNTVNNINQSNHTWIYSGQYIPQLQWFPQILICGYKFHVMSWVWFAVNHLT